MFDASELQIRKNGSHRAVFHDKVASAVNHVAVEVAPSITVAHWHHNVLVVGF